MVSEGGLSSAVARVRRVPQWIGELLLVAVIYLAYEFGRGVHKGTLATARSTGKTLLRWEHTLHIDPEKWLTVHLDHLTWLAVPASYVYASAHYIITPIVLIWLYRRHHPVYGPARTWLAISTLISLVIFNVLPTAPPRLLHYGYPDVLADVQQYGWWSNQGSAPKHLGGLTNQFAAMPSMHVGWALWCGFLIYRYASRSWVRALGVLYPCVTTMVVLSTGNHYLLDVVAGALVMGAGALVSVGFTRGRRRQRRNHRGDASSLLRPSAVGAPGTSGSAGQNDARASAIDKSLGTAGAAGHTVRQPRSHSHT